MQASLELRLPEAVRVLVAGEVVLDRYLWGDVSRISPEAPIPVLQVKRREQRPGNAAFVCANLAAFGARPSLLSVVGADAHGAALRAMLAGLGVDTAGLIEDRARPTIVKERLLGSVQSANRATQQLLRVDDEDTTPLSAEVEQRLIAALPAALSNADGVLVCDIDKGVLTPALLRAIIDGARERGKPVIVDPRRADDLSIYRGATALTPNRFETERATGLTVAGPYTRLEAAHKLLDALELEICLVTLDRDGMYLAWRGGGMHVETNPREVYDVTGAGDVVLAVFGLLLIGGTGAARAAALANVAAGLEVGCHGAAVITREQLLDAIRQADDGSSRKIMAAAQVRERLGRERAAGRRIAFTNLGSDALHPGHIRLLESARRQADVLVVGLSQSYPHGNGAAGRARMVAAMECVDYVVALEARELEGFIRETAPDALISAAGRGGAALADYRAEQE